MDLHRFRYFVQSDDWSVDMPFFRAQWLILLTPCPLVITALEALLIKPRLFWLLPTTAMCGVGEIIGWSGRLMDSKNPLNHNAFLMQCVHILSTTWFKA